MPLFLKAEILEYSAFIINTSSKKISVDELSCYFYHEIGILSGLFKHSFHTPHILAIMLCEDGIREKE